MLMAAIGTSAQNTESAYFLDDYTYRYQMNPAFANSRGFVAFPGLGNLNVGISGNLGVQDVLYNVNGKTVTFMHPGVSAQEVMSNIGTNNRFDVNLRETILAFGFKGFHGYNTITLSARADVGVKLPKSIFSFLKEGVTNDSYDIANVKAQGQAWAELAFAHSHDLSKVLPGLRIGAAVKVLLGAGNVDANLEEANLTLGTDDWVVRSNGTIKSSLKGLTYKTKVNKNTGHRYVSGADVDGAGVGGFGIGLDLGAVYKPHLDIPILDDFEFSLGILDLGFISWSNNMLATTNGVQTFNTDKYTFNVDDDAVNSFDNEWDKIKDDVSALYELNDEGDQGGRTTMLGTTFNIGACYQFPLYKGLKFGLLNTTHAQGEFSWTDFRLSANVIPCKVFDAAVNVHGGTFGVGFGGIVNLHAPGFNFFLAADAFPTKLAKQGAPLTSNAQINLGINFLIH